MSPDPSEREESPIANPGSTRASAAGEASTSPGAIAQESTVDASAESEIDLVSGGAESETETARNSGSTSSGGADVSQSAVEASASAAPGDTAAPARSAVEAESSPAPAGPSLEKEAPREKSTDSVRVVSEVRAPSRAVTVLRACALAVSAVWLVSALVVAAWFGAGWGMAAWRDGPRAEARDNALDGARQAALNMTSMNLDDVPGSLALARSSMTGALLDSATKNQDQAEKLARQTAVGMSSKVLGAALTSLDSEEDKASALVVLQVTEKGKDKPPAEYRYTWTVDVVKDGDVWKAAQISSLSQPVLLNESAGRQTSAPAGGQQPAAPKPGS